jgi:cytochrome P450
VVTTHRDVSAAARATRALSSEFGMTIDTLSDARDRSAGLMLELTDPPRHARLRRIVSAAFAPGRVELLRPRIEAIADQLVRDVAAGGEPFDVVGDLAARLPLRVVATLLGLAEDDLPFIERCLETMFASRPATAAVGRPSAVATAGRTASVRLLGYLGDVLRRRSAPGDDLLGALATAEIAGDRLTGTEVVMNAYNLLIGGSLSTRYTLAGGLLALAEEPEAWRRLCQGGDLAAAVEEILRWTTAGMHLVRTATGDTTIGGVEIRSGEPVALWLASANRDESVFDAPDEFRIDRDPNPHLTFATGAHACIGSALARLQLTVLLARLADTGAALRLAGPVRWVESNFLSGPASLPLRLEGG